MVALIAQLALVTSIVIGFLLLVYFALKQNPRLLQGFTLNAMLPTPNASSGLVIESRLPLDARKSLMVIRAGDERYLIGATIDRIDAITRMGDTPAVATHNHSASEAAVSAELYQTAQPDPRPVGLSRFATPVQAAVTPAAAPIHAMPNMAAQTLSGNFQQQLYQVAQTAHKGNGQLPINQPVIPQPRRQTRHLNRLT